MSQVHVSIVRCSNVAEANHGTPLYVEDSDSIGTAEVITSGVASQASTLAVPSSPNFRHLAWRVANMGTDNIFVAFGAAPTATAAGKGLPAGQIGYFGCSAVGDKVAAINS